MMKRSNKILIIMLACAGVAMGFGFFVIRSRSGPLPTPQTNVTDQKTTPAPVVKDVPKQDAPVVTTDWKVYTNDKHGFSISYPPYLKAGSVSDNSVLGTYQVPVRGLHVGSLLLIALKDPSVKKSAVELFQGVYDAAKNPKPAIGAEVAPVECKIELDTAKIRAVSCNGEGGAARYAYITGTAYDVFVDGYSKGYDKQDNGNLKDADFKTILSTFKFASETSASASPNPVIPPTAASPTPGTTPPTPTTPPTTPTIQMFTINADDSSATPSQITVNKGAIVQITFIVGTNTYYGGLDFKSSVVNSGTVNAGQSKTISFKAGESFQFTPYWPASSVAKNYKIAVTVQ
ncbi:MAG TPA: hypothetical protein VF974_04610 [Patescibacteria group bacterium]